MHWRFCHAPPQALSKLAILLNDLQALLRPAKPSQVCARAHTRASDDRKHACSCPQALPPPATPTPWAVCPSPAPCPPCSTASLRQSCPSRAQRCVQEGWFSPMWGRGGSLPYLACAAPPGALPCPATQHTHTRMRASTLLPLSLTRVPTHPPRAQGGVAHVSNDPQASLQLARRSFIKTGMPHTSVPLEQRASFQLSVQRTSIQVCKSRRSTPGRVVVGIACKASLKLGLWI